MSTAAERPPSRHKKMFLGYNFPAGATSATGTVTADTNANMADADKVVLSDGFVTKTYEYDKSANGVTAGNVSWTAGTSAATVATNLKTAINATQPAFTVADNLAGVLTITNNWPGAGGNVTTTKTSSSALAVTGMSGGTTVGGNTTVDTTVKLFKAMIRSIKVTRVSLILPVGLTADASNYCNFKIIKGASTIMANWSTQTGMQGTITANTHVEMVLSATVANLYLADGDIMSLFIDVTGTPTVPPGRVVIEGTEF